VRVYVCVWPGRGNGRRSAGLWGANTRVKNRKRRQHAPYLLYKLCCPVRWVCGLPQTCHGGKSLFACCLISVSTCLPATACLIVFDLEVCVVLVRKSDLVGLLELLRVLGHHSLVDGNLGGRKCGWLDKLEVRVANKFLGKPLERLLELIIGTCWDLIILEVLLPVTFPMTIRCHPAFPQTQWIGPTPQHPTPHGVPHCTTSQTSRSEENGATSNDVQNSNQAEIDYRCHYKETCGSWSAWS